MSQKEGFKMNNRNESNKAVYEASMVLTFLYEFWEYLVLQFEDTEWAQRSLSEEEIKNLKAVLDMGMSIPGREYDFLKIGLIELQKTETIMEVLEETERLLTTMCHTESLEFLKREEAGCEIAEKIGKTFLDAYIAEEIEEITYECNPKLYLLLRKEEFSGGWVIINSATTKNIAEDKEIVYRDDIGNRVDYLTLPNKVNDIPVVGIAENAFERAYIQKRVIFPEYLLFIGDSAFLHSALSLKIEFPEWLESIGNMAFVSGCMKARLLLPRYLKKIGDDAFRRAVFTGEFVIPVKMESIGRNSFPSSEFSGNLTLPKSMKSIGSLALQSSAFIGTLQLGEAHIESQALRNSRFDKIDDLYGNTKVRKDSSGKYFI